MVALATIALGGCVGTLERPFTGDLQGADPRGDQWTSSAGGNNPLADIAEFGVYYRPTELVVAINTVAPNDFVNDPNWHDHAAPSSIRVGFETTNNDAIDFLLTVAPDNNGNLSAEVMETVNNSRTCSPAFGYSGNQVQITVDPMKCFGGAGPLRTWLSVAYRTSTQYSEDTAPESPAWSPWIQANGTLS